MPTDAIARLRQRTLMVLGLIYELETAGRQLILPTTRNWFGNKRWNPVPELLLTAECWNCSAYPGMCTGTGNTLDRSGLLGALEDARRRKWLEKSRLPWDGRLDFDAYRRPDARVVTVWCGSPRFPEPVGQTQLAPTFVAKIWPATFRPYADPPSTPWSANDLWLDHYDNHDEARLASRHVVPEMVDWAYRVADAGLAELDRTVVDAAGAKSKENRTTSGRRRRRAPRTEPTTKQFEAMVAVEKYCSLREAARQLGKSPSTVDGLVKRGKATLPKRGQSVRTTASLREDGT